jgi:serine/threonine-protein kinase
VLFQMLTGHVVFEGDSDVSKLWAHVHEPPPRLSALRRDLPRRLDDVLARALAKDPGARHASAGELARDAMRAVA